MIQIKKEKYGSYVEATITIKIQAYLPENDERTEIAEEDAINFTLKKLYSLAESNTGSELLANIRPSQISFI